MSLNKTTPDDPKAGGKSGGGKTPATPANQPIQANVTYIKNCNYLYLAKRKIEKICNYITCLEL